MSFTNKGIMQRKEQTEDGELLYHTSCIGEDCTSSDAMAVYKKQNKDGTSKLDAFCFSCQGYFKESELEEQGVTEQESKGNVVKDAEVDFSSIESIKFRGWKERGITRFTSEKYGVHTELNSENEVISRYYPVTNKGKITGYKKRTTPKTFMGIGNTKATSELFGQNVFESGQKYIVVTTGEEDAMAFAEVLRSTSNGVEYWTPCVSITAGDGSIIKQFKANYEYLASFGKIVLAFDNDEPGQKYLEEAARILPPGKVFIAKFPRGSKDACDMLQADKGTELKQIFWKAEPFSRVDVLHLSQMWDDFENEDSNEKIPFPPAWSHLNEMMNGGMERGEISLLGALTSIGKSTLVSNIVYNLIENTKFKVGVMYLEGTKREVVRDLLSLDASVNLRIKSRDVIDIDALKKRFFDGLAKRDQFTYVDHQGSISTDEIFDKLNYLAKAEGCDVIVVDPIQCAVNSSDNAAIIGFMDTLLKFAKETDVCVIAVSHMKKPSDENPHNVTEYSLLGSSSLNQIAFNTILLSRDKMNPCPIKKSATKLQLVKCRRTGNTGDAGWLKYDHETTHLFATSDPYEQTLVTEEEAKAMQRPQNVVIDF